MTARPVSVRRLAAVLAAGAATAGLAVALPAASGALTPVGRVVRTHAAKTKPSSLPICRRVQARANGLQLQQRKTLPMLVTGDSMVFPVHAELSSILRSRGVHVTADRRDGTGLTTTDTVVWRTLAKQQVKKLKPAVTVITLGGRDGGLPLTGAKGKQVDCCGPAWVALYAAKVRPLVRTYLRSGAGRLYWLLLPAPREQARVGLYKVINDTLRTVAPEFGDRMRLIPVDDALSPHYAFKNSVTYDGLKISPRTSDGIHLNHAGACVEVDLVMSAMVADGVFGPPAPPAAR